MNNRILWLTRPGSTDDLLLICSNMEVLARQKSALNGLSCTYL